MFQSTWTHIQSICPESVAFWAGVLGLLGAPMVYWSQSRKHLRIRTSTHKPRTSWQTPGLELVFPARWSISGWYSSFKWRSKNQWIICDADSQKKVSTQSFSAQNFIQTQRLLPRASPLKDHQNQRRNAPNVQPRLHTQFTDEPVEEEKVYYVAGPLALAQHESGWWFGAFFIFPYIGKNHPNWLSYFSEGLKPSTSEWSLEQFLRLQKGCGKTEGME